ncbi:hypothetical protein L2E82_49346 [Cichorium intybus]|uniref:Uncharacterized protein n=1 Tax=Cichorium intybus TaxID=13427 RepID=A0ACB8Z184_CICIN|nr:hypothetical protein L2E82_49346 [Cichorium intybus]
MLSIVIAMDFRKFEANSSSGCSETSTAISTALKESNIANGRKRNGGDEFNRANGCQRSHASSCQEPFTGIRHEENGG